MHKRHPISPPFADRLLDVMYYVAEQLFNCGHYSKEILPMNYFMRAPLNALFIWDTKSAPRTPDLRSASTEALSIGFEKKYP